MRLRAAILAVLLLLLASCGSSRSQSAGGRGGSGAGGSGGVQPAHCGDSRARTLVASADARVYLSGRTVFGCSPRGSRSFRLGEQGVGCIGAGRIQTVAAAGRLAAYGIERCGVDTGSSVVMVRRLSDGAVVSSEPAITKAVAVEAFQTLSGLVLRSDGAVAWIASLSSVIPHRHVSEIHRLDRHGFSLLDSGPGGSLTRLRLNGSTLSWLHAGGPRSAPLS